jgi:cytochrome c peroxidase
VKIDADQDRVTSKLPALQFYQLSLPAPKPVAGRDFDQAAAARGDVLFEDKANCIRCHTEPLWTEPGWNLHTPAEIHLDDFQANRSPDKRYRTSPLAGIFSRPKGGFFHDGRFATLTEVVQHYNSEFNLQLTDAEISDLVEYLKSL